MPKLLIGSKAIEIWNELQRISKGKYGRKESSSWTFGR
jgi:hypothetical protein